MKYDFTSDFDRSGKDALAIDGLGSEEFPEYPPKPKEGFDAIPMWCADMNLPTCPAIPEAIIRRASHPAYGCFDHTDKYYNSIIRWHESRNKVTTMTRRDIGYENSIIGGLKTALRVFCSPGDYILLHSPTYTGFTNPLSNAGYRISASPLTRDADGIWRMDFEDMEKRIVQNKIHAAVLCSPHNPTGRVWERWELERAMDIFSRHNVFVISDEIWSDLIFPGFQHIPTQSISEDARNRTVALYSPSKGFNMAGMRGAYHVVYNDWIRDRINREARLTSYNHMNVLLMHAQIAAYSEEGGRWLDELNEVLASNLNFGVDYINNHFAGVTVARPQGTYLLYLECGEWCAAHGKTPDELIQAGWDVGVMWQDARVYRGPGHIRMILASTPSRVREAFERLDRYVFNGADA